MMTCKMTAKLMQQITLMVFAVFMAFVCGSGLAATSVGNSSFNHNTTGFALSGAHNRVSCESCHTQGVFRGTPKDCASCHRPGGKAPGKPANHISTTIACDSCHLPSGWTPVYFNHEMTQGVVKGQCATCHNNGAVKGKPAAHIRTNSSCDTCHSSKAWLPASFNHREATPFNCATCHNGLISVGKPPNHPFTLASCAACHRTTAWLPVIKFNHLDIVNNCTRCHVSGSQTTAPPAPLDTLHSNVSNVTRCEACHRTTTDFKSGASFDHRLTTASCASCHNGVAAIGKSTSHISTTAQCDTCHSSTTTFSGAAFNHATANPPVAGRCDTCHGVTAGVKAKSTTNIPTTAQCDTCHKNTQNFVPAVMSHSATKGPLSAGNCATCHSGSFVAVNALAKPVNHVSTSAQCDTCHNSTTTFKGAVFDHAAATPPVAGRCDTCHGVTAGVKAKSTTHIPTTAQCDTCHRNTTAFAPATMSHSGTTGPLAAGNCATCHSGSYVAVNALAKPTNHVSTTAQCDTCHRSTTTFAGAVFDHAAASPPVAGRCDTCHGVTAGVKAKSTTHIPTTAQCDTCHRNTTAFAPATMSHSGTTGPLAAGNCATCHSGSYVAVNALAKPTNHVSTTAQCDTCHRSTTTFAGAVFDHNAVSPPVAGRCSSCHGVTATGKPGTHIPTTAQCDTCHRNTTAFAPATMSHSGTTGPIATGNCATCHSGAYISANALAKPTNHVSTTAQCDTCHSSTTTFSGAVFNHSLVTPPVAGRCSSCHGVTATGKPGTHIPTTAQCDTCHRNTTAFAPATMSHTGTTGPIATGNCATCHNGSYVAVNAQAKPSNHIPTTFPTGMPGNECSLCHTSTSQFSTERMNHGSMQTSCVTCHDSTSPYLGNMEKINRSRHNNAGTKDCSSSGCHKPLGSKGSTYTNWD